LEVPPEYVGKKVRCPRCRAVVQVPPAGVDILSPPAAIQAPVPQQPAVVFPTPSVSRPEPSLPPAHDFEPVTFLVRVNDPTRELAGRFTAMVDCDGLHLRDGGVEHTFSRGCDISYDGGNRLVLAHDRRAVRVSVIDNQFEGRKLARDLVAFLRGRLDSLVAATYRIPPTRYWPLLFAPLPLGVPVVIAVLWLAGVVGAVTWLMSAAVALTSALIALGLMLLDRKTLIRRLIWPAGMTVACAFGVTLLYVGGTAIGSALNLTASWRTYTPPSGKWSIQMPGNVVVSRKSAPDLPDILMDEHLCRIALGRAEFVVTVADLNQRGANPATPDQRFEAAKQAILTKDAQMRLVSEKNIMLQGRYPGRDFVFSHARIGTAHFRVFVVGSDLYVLGCGGHAMDESDFQRFLDSFQVHSPAGRG
jgi:hypothetical protein